jgi:ribonuclease Z
MHLLGRDKGITIYGPKELEQIIRLQLEVGGAKLNFSCDFVALEPKGKELIFEDKMLEIWTFPMKHRIPSNGFQIKEKQKERPLDAEKFKEDKLSLTFAPILKQGHDITMNDGTVIYADDYTFPPPPVKSYAYCSDTIYFPEMIPYIKGSTVLYHEATFLHKMLDRARVTFHTTAQQAGEIAKEAGVFKLLLGHLSSRYETAEEHILEAKTSFKNVLVVEDGDVIDI